MKKYTKEELYKMDAVEVYKLVLEGNYIKRFPAGFWQQPEALDNAVKCIRYLIEDILNWNEEELKKRLSRKIFLNHKLRGMLTTCFNDSSIKAIEVAYPDKFKPWEFNQAPQGYWNDINNGIKATRWLIEDKLQLTDDELRQQLSKTLFIDNGLGAMLQYCFDCSTKKAIELAYPNKFKPWEFKITSRGCWYDDKNKIDAIRWLIEDKLKLTDEELKEQLSVKLFVDNSLGGMLALYFDNSPFKAIESAYPNKFKPWEFNQVPQSYWNDINNGIEATRWLVETKLKLTDSELKEQLSRKLFADNGLSGMLQYCFDFSPFKAIDAAYSGKFKPWEFNIVSKGYWDNISNGIEATRWLIEEKLKLTDEELKKQLSIKLFTDNGLGGMLSTCFNSSPFEAINTAYPGKFKPWEFNIVSKGYWDNISNGIEAIRWLIEEKLKLTDNELKKQLSLKIFNDNGLGGMLKICFNNSPFKAINAAYPEKFKKEDFKNYNLIK